LAFAQSYTWTTAIDYNASDFPADGIRGPGEDENTAYPTRMASAGTNPFYVSFKSMFVDETGRSLVRGGDLLLSVLTTVAGIPIFATNANEGDVSIQILGTNPIKGAVHDYVDGFFAPPNWPSDTSYDFHTIIRKIISDETGGQVIQFDGGVPLWSQDTFRGAGLMQLTNPHPTLDQIWNWKTNVTFGVGLLVGDKLASAIAHLEGRAIFDRKGHITGRTGGLFQAVQKEAATIGAIAAPITGDMIVAEAIRAYNTYDNGTGDIDEWRPVRDSKGNLVITNGTTSWEHVPPDQRHIGVDPTKIKGTPDYVNRVLMASDF
jgi:hypothetical protein